MLRNLQTTPFEMKALTSTEIFISYRRDDAGHMAGRVYGNLREHFGDHAIFMDTGIEGGEDFTKVLEGEGKSCKVLIAFIGKEWLSETNRRRLNEADDWVRREIATALSRGITILPLLVDAAMMPTANDLSADLVKLCNQQALKIDNADYDYRLKKLIQRLESIVFPWKKWTRRALIGGVAAGFVVGLFYFGPVDAFRSIRVQSALAKNPILQGLKIYVRSDGGVVTLSGDFGTEAQSNTAVTVSMNVTGVKSVVSLMRFSDEAITNRVKDALKNTASVSGLSIEVETSDGVVTLMGNVREDLQKRRAGEAVSSVNGVKQVINQLKVTTR